MSPSTIPARRTATLLAAVAAALLVLAPAALADPPPIDSATTTGYGAIGSLHQTGTQPDRGAIPIGPLSACAACRPVQVPVAAKPNLYAYEFDHRLKLGGAVFTPEGAVLVTVRSDDGRLRFSSTVTAHENGVATGGSIFVDTRLPFCNGKTDGIAFAYDYVTAQHTYPVRVRTTPCYTY